MVWHRRSAWNRGPACARQNQKLRFKLLEGANVATAASDLVMKYQVYDVDQGEALVEPARIMYINNDIHTVVMLLKLARREIKGWKALDMELCDAKKKINKLNSTGRIVTNTRSRR